MPNALAAAATVALSTYFLFPAHPDLRRLTPPQPRTKPRPPSSHRLAATAAALAALILIGLPWGL
ncbi:MAG TPA: hypothetical protein VGL05_09485, partial [Kribbella sp.]